MKFKVWFSLAILFCSFPIAANAADENLATARSSVDRADDLSGYQIRLIYVLPAGARDRMLDTNGTISNWIGQVRTISRTQIGLTPIFDLYLGKPDVGFLQSKYSLAELSTSKGAIELLTKELSTSEQIGLKGVGFIIDGMPRNSDYCGYASRPGKYFTAWLGQSCWEDTDQYKNRPYWTYIASTILHEWLHNLGVTHTCVKNDLMWGAGCDAASSGDGNSIDASRGNYVRAEKSGVDISLLPVWEESPKADVIQLGFRDLDKSVNPSRFTSGKDNIWAKFYLANNWVEPSSVQWECEVFTSGGIVLNSSVASGLCESKILTNFKIGTRIYLRVTANGLWQRSSSITVFTVLGQNGESSYCESKTCILGETVKLDPGLCFSTEGFAKLEIKRAENWVTLKTQRAMKGNSACSSGNSYFVATAVQDMPVGTNILRWTWATDRAFSKSVTTYKEFQVEIQTEAKK